MASIRLFGRGRNTAAAGGPAVDAALIADALEGLTAASMSTTWRCRHGAGVSIGEGAVDFEARRSRATVIRGKYTFEYVRSGSSVYRVAVTDADAAGTAAVAPSKSAEPELDPGVDDADDAAADEDEEDGAGLDPDEDLDPDAVDVEADEEADADDADAEEDGDFGDDEEEDADAADENDDSDALDVSEPDVSAADADAVVTAWEAFSDHDACGVHAYAEPAVLAAGVRAAGVVQPRGTQEVDGVALSAYAVTLKPKPGDPNRLLARLARQLRDHGANVVVVTAFMNDSAADSGDDGESDDGDGPGRIVRLRVELPHWTPADDPTADHTVSVDLFEFDEPVKIDMPDAQGAKRRAARSCADLALF
ncbi:MAG TPA: hypothetical protein VGS97_04745 [Actinocrinis sp.]|uniref:hypothetical protein n=1 Tax=Actinocrinis sp. TaxID=1920516 RepID=UPI002DDD31C0|nr:hypothetical protein [Actinocrinis sp.]HEV2343379.1 hypothetical protein [Actinocrinis sp.]